MFNEEAGILRFLDKELLGALEVLPYATEVILVDDGSEDRTVEKVATAELRKKFPVRLVAFSRNFGKEVALSAGLREATGEAVIMIDADGQHPVSAIPEMIRKWEEGAEIVTAIRKTNRTKHKLGSKIFYKLMKIFGNGRIREGEMDFRLLDRVIVEEFNEFTERNRVARGLIDWLGFRQEYVKVEIKGRESGKPSQSFRKLLTLAGDSFVSLSRTPLVIFGYLGLLITFVSGVLGLFILVEQYILGDPLGLDWAGAVAVSIFVAFLVGIVLISQAITALYISQIHAETKNRPLYVVDRKKSWER